MTVLINEASEVIPHSTPHPLTFLFTNVCLNILMGIRWKEKHMGAKVNSPKPPDIPDL